MAELGGLLKSQERLLELEKVPFTFQLIVSVRQPASSNEEHVMESIRLLLEH